MNLVIFGPPGAGKGTQSKFISEKFNMFQLSTGEFLRREISQGTEIGKKISSVINSGALVSDQIVSDLIEKIISNKKYQNRIIFDGYPRNLIQAQNLDNLLKKHNQKIDVVLKLVVSLDTIKKSKRNIFWSVRFSVFKVFRMGAGFNFDLLSHGMINGIMRGTLFLYFE